MRSKKLKRPGQNAGPFLCNEIDLSGCFEARHHVQLEVVRKAFTVEQVAAAARGTATRLIVALGGGGVAASFVRDYAHKYRRQALLAHPARHRELIERINRESLLAMVARLERDLPRRFTPSSASRARRKNAVDTVLVNLFRVNFYARLAELADWGREELASFWRDVDLYAGAARVPRSPTSPRGRRSRKIDRHLGAFADRCAFLLDSSLLEKARRAAAILHRRLERKAMIAAGAAFRSAGIAISVSRKRPPRRRTPRHPSRKTARKKRPVARRFKKTVRRKRIGSNKKPKPRRKGAPR